MGELRLWGLTSWPRESFLIRVSVFKMLCDYITSFDNSAVRSVYSELHVRGLQLRGWDDCQVPLSPWWLENVYWNCAHSMGTFPCWPFMLRSTAWVPNSVNGTHFGVSCVPVLKVSVTHHYFQGLFPPRQQTSTNPSVTISSLSLQHFYSFHQTPGKEESILYKNTIVPELEHLGGPHTLDWGRSLVPPNLHVLACTQEYLKIVFYGFLLVSVWLNSFSCLNPFKTYT